VDVPSVRKPLCASYVRFTKAFAGVLLEIVRLAG
jgi:hypothetical protein